MIEININKMHGEKGRYFLSLISPMSMRDNLYLHFDCINCVKSVLNTLTYAIQDEIQITNHTGEDLK